MVALTLNPDLYEIDSFEEFPHDYDLTLGEVKLREKFVEQFMIDHDYFKACLRIGYTGDNAKEFANRFRTDPLVNQLLAKALVARENEDQEVTRSKIRNAMLSEGFRPDNIPSARIAALTQAAKFYGMESPVKIQQEVTHAGSVTHKHKFELEKLSKEQLSAYRGLLQSLVKTEGEEKVDV